jgi:hypothetical protein
MTDKKGWPRLEPPALFDDEREDGARSSGQPTPVAGELVKTFAF